MPKKVTLNNLQEAGTGFFLVSLTPNALDTLARQTGHAAFHSTCFVAQKGLVGTAFLLLLKDVPEKSPDYIHGRDGWYFGNDSEGASIAHDGVVFDCVNKAYDAAQDISQGNTYRIITLTERNARDLNMENSTGLSPAAWKAGNTYISKSVSATRSIVYRGDVTLSHKLACQMYGSLFSTDIEKPAYSDETFKSFQEAREYLLRVNREAKAMSHATFFDVLAGGLYGVASLPSDHVLVKASVKNGANSRVTVKRSGIGFGNFFGFKVLDRNGRVAYETGSTGICVDSLETYSTPQAAYAASKGKPFKEGAIKSVYPRMLCNKFYVVDLSAVGKMFLHTCVNKPRGDFVVCTPSLSTSLTRSVGLFAGDNTAVEWALGYDEVNEVLGYEFDTFEDALEFMVEVLGVPPAPIASTPVEPVLESSNITHNPKASAGSVKLDMASLPPTAVAHVALAFAEGAAKYGADNFSTNNSAASVYLNAIYRHLAQWELGDNCDAQTKVNHLASIAANCMILLDATERGTLVDDRKPSFDMAELMQRLGAVQKDLRDDANGK